MACICSLQRTKMVVPWHNAQHDEHRTRWPLSVDRTSIPNDRRRHTCGTTTADLQEKQWTLQCHVKMLTEVLQDFWHYLPSTTEGEAKKMYKTFWKEQHTIWRKYTLTEDRKEQVNGREIANHNQKSLVGKIVPTVAVKVSNYNSPWRILPN